MALGVEDKGLENGARSGVTGASTPVRVALLADRLVRAGLTLSLAGEESPCAMVWEVGDPAEVLPAARRLAPDVVVMDLDIPGDAVTDACRTLREELPDVGVLGLSNDEQSEALIMALLAGASAFVLRSAEPRAIREAIHVAARGDGLPDQRITARLFEWMRASGRRLTDSDAVSDLTAQEGRVLGAIGRGLTNQQIAEELDISARTVRNYCTRIYSKLNIRNRAQAAVFATERRLQGLAL